jgi:hypothetical protein
LERMWYNISARLVRKRAARVVDEQSDKKSPEAVAPGDSRVGSDSKLRVEKRPFSLSTQGDELTLRCPLCSALELRGLARL